MKIIAQGKGKIHDSKTNKPIYEGDFLENKAHGIGKETLQNGDIYLGNFYEG